MTADREPFMTVAELAAWLRLDESTVRDHAARGVLPATRIGGVWRFRESRILVWLGEQDNQARPQITRIRRRATQRPEPTTGRREMGGRR